LIKKGPIARRISRALCDQRCGCGENRVSESIRNANSLNFDASEAAATDRRAKDLMWVYSATLGTRVVTTFLTHRLAFKAQALGFGRQASNTSQENTKQEQE
jgi:hypothetical protein